MSGRSPVYSAWLIAGCCCLSSVTQASAAALSFAQRVDAQREIERVYHRHIQDSTRTFEQAVTTELLEQKVRTQLEQSLLLETMWHTPVTAAALDAEMNRIARSTLLPERLHEIYDALGNDPFLVRETFARASLVNRLSRSFFANDRTIHAAALEEAESIWSALRKGDLDVHGAHPQRAVLTLARQEVGAREWGRLRSPHRAGEVERPVERPEAFVIRAVLKADAESAEVATWSVPKRTWEAWWQTIEPELDDSLVAAVASSEDLPIPQGIDASEQALTANCHPAGQWSSGSLDDLHAARREHIAIWTGQLMLIWGGYEAGGAIVTAPGERYDPLTDSWSPMTAVNEPPVGLATAGVWTGSEMIVWGSVYGGRYDPVTDVWRTVSSAGAPQARARHTAVWTGSRMLVWGGEWAAPGSLNDGGLYDPATDTWSLMSLTGAPAPRHSHTAVWTGNRMVVWGGMVTGGGGNTGGRYDPATDTWSSTQTLGAPSARIRHTAVWTGSRMIVWGGVLGAGGLAGGRYDPVDDSWTATANAPEARERHSAIWTGTEMIVWGGNTQNVDLGSRTGARYDPATNQWRSVSTQRHPDARLWHSAVWTGSLMIVWGGTREYTEINLADGGRYDPAADTWTSMSPALRFWHSAVWTGTEMIVWGGGAFGGVRFDSGGRYDPLLDAWTPTSLQGAPTARGGHSAVWTGTEMIVWGGSDGSYTNTGGRYDPVADSWTPVATNNAPAPRSSHKAVWTGARMIVWGGQDASYLNTGGRYDPSSNSWTAMATAGAPVGRTLHTALWTGQKMIVWGGYNGSVLGSGGLYDPALNTWQATSLTGAPSARYGNAAVWTGSHMIVYGGTISSPTGDTGTTTGGRYRPDTDTWSPTSQTGTPQPGLYGDAFVSVWSGSRMLIWGPNGKSGSYHPGSNTWSSLPSGAPDYSLDGYTAVWDGGGMILWGYTFNNLHALGGRYVPGPDLSGDADADGVTVCAGDCNDSDPAVRPGGAQICDGKNNDCSHPSWPSLAGTNETADGDGDAVSTCADCNDGSAAVWGPPSEALNLQLSAANALSWDAPTQPGASSVRYDTLRSAAAPDFVGAAACVESDDASDRTATDLSIPPPGSVYYYLVRGENGCPGALGIGPLGASSNGSPSAGRTCP